MKYQVQKLLIRSFKEELSDWKYWQETSRNITKWKLHLHQNLALKETRLISTDLKLEEGKKCYCIFCQYDVTDKTRDFESGDHKLRSEASQTKSMKDKFLTKFFVR